MDQLAREAVDLLNETYGRHPGHRALHAKGMLCKGTFTASPEAAKLTRAAHMQGEPVPVTVRFSNGSGDPRLPTTPPTSAGWRRSSTCRTGRGRTSCAQTAPLPRPHPR